MQRHHGQFHRECDEESEHQPRLDRLRQRRIEQLDVVEAEHARYLRMDEREREYREEHQQPGCLREDHVLRGRVDPTAAAGHIVAPQRDQEKERHQHHFPEAEEQEQIDRQENANDTTEAPQQIRMERTDTAADFAPRTRHCEETNEPGQPDEQQRQSVEREVKPDAET